MLSPLITTSRFRVHDAPGASKTLLHNHPTPRYPYDPGGDQASEGHDRKVRDLDDVVRARGDCSILPRRRVFAELYPNLASNQAPVG